MELHLRTIGGIKEGGWQIAAMTWKQVYKISGKYSLIKNSITLLRIIAKPGLDKTKD
jgi:hypothetical protein